MVSFQTEIWLVNECESLRGRVGLEEWENLDKRNIQELGLKSGILYNDNKAQYVTMTIARARGQKFRQTNHIISSSY